MSKGKDLREVQEDYKKTVVGLCITCGKPVSCWYGVWGNGGSCSRPCEVKQEAKPKYPDHPPGETFDVDDILWSGE